MSPGHQKAPKGGHWPAGVLRWGAGVQSRGPPHTWEQPTEGTV